MKKIIGGKRYDTDTAREMASASSPEGRSDFHWWEETLYRKSTGEYFLHGEGGPMSRYARSCGQNQWSGGEKIIPMTLKSAQEWAEENLSGDEYEAIFGVVEESTDKKTCTFSLTEATIEKIARMAQQNEITKSDVIEKLVMLYIK